MQLPDINKRKILSHTTSVVNKQKQTEDRKTYVISNIVSIVLSPSKKADQNKVNVIKVLLQYSMSSAYCKKRLLQTWTFNFSSPKYRGGMVYKTMHGLTKKMSKSMK